MQQCLLDKSENTIYDKLKILSCDDDERKFLKKMEEGQDDRHGTLLAGDGDLTPNDGSLPKLSSSSILEAGSHQSILESILVQKMSLAASTNFMRSNSVHSVDSVCSAGSLTSDDHCRCDDCILGITDMLVDVSEMRFVAVVNPSGGMPASPKGFLRRKVCVDYYA